MAQQDSRASTMGDGRGSWESHTPERGYDEGPSLGELLKRLTNDTGELISQEISLAKAEMKESAATAAKSAVKLGVAMTLGLVGAIALTAAAVIGLGNLTDGGYWLWALVIGGVELVAAMMAAKGALESMKSGDLKPEETIDSLREDKEWAKNEARDLKRDLGARQTTTNTVR